MVKMMINSIFTPQDGQYQKGDHWYCPDCNEPVTWFSDKPELAGWLLPKNCKCKRERLAEKGKQDEKDRKAKIEERRKRAFGCHDGKPNIEMEFTFANDDGRSPEATAKLKAYCINFEAKREAGEGIIIQSAQNGSGKTFFACAVANELIDLGYSVSVTSFSALNEKLYNPKSYKSNDSLDFLHQLESHDLIVIDDLGAENSNKFMLSQEYTIVDYLTKRKVPLIITTNYTKQELAKEENIDKRRVFDRIFGNCGIITV